MNMTLKRKLFEPQEIKEMYPLTEEGAACKQKNDAEIRDILEKIDLNSMSPLDAFDTIRAVKAKLGSGK